MTIPSNDWPDTDIRFGTPEEWTAFAERHGRFLERFSRLHEALKTAFLRTLEKVEKTDVLLFFIGRQCVDDFCEILTLCGNAEGYGAQKLLRAMFERVVLLKYLHKHPNLVDLYFSYYHVTRHKQMMAAERFWGAGTVPPTHLEDARRRYDEIKDQYKTRKCKKCGFVEMGMAWTQVPLPEMAEEVGLGKFVLPAYYEPLLQAHPNLQGLLRRLEDGPSDEHGISYGDRLNRSLADDVLLAAHGLLLSVLEVQVNHFMLPEDRFEALGDDFKYVWAKTSVEPQSAVPDTGAE